MHEPASAASTETFYSGGTLRVTQEVAEESSGPIPEAVAVALVNILLFFLIFGISATVDVTALRQQLRNKYAIATGLGMQFIAMPLMGFLVVKILSDRAGLAPASGISLLIVTSSPGGTLSNFFCSAFNADLALSIGLTSLSTLLSTVLLPANLLLYSNAVYGFGSTNPDGMEGGNVLSSLDLTSLFISIGVVLAATVTGLFASYKAKSRVFSRRANRFGSLSGLALVVVSIIITATGGGAGAGGRLWTQPWSFYVGVAAPCVLGLGLSVALSLCARLARPEIVTVGIEVCYQNVNLATSSAVTMFSGAQQTEALLVPIFYGFVQAAVALVYCVAAWKGGWTKAPSDEKFCVVVSKVYEVPDDDDDANEGVDVVDKGTSSSNEADLEQGSSADEEESRQGDESSQEETWNEDETPKEQVMSENIPVISKVTPC